MQTSTWPGRNGASGRVSADLRPKGSGLRQHLSRRPLIGVSGTFGGPRYPTRQSGPGLGGLVHPPPILGMSGSVAVGVTAGWLLSCRSVT